MWFAVEHFAKKKNNFVFPYIHCHVVGTIKKSSRCHCSSRSRHFRATSAQNDEYLEAMVNTDKTCLCLHSEGKIDVNKSISLHITTKELVNGEFFFLSCVPE